MAVGSGAVVAGVSPAGASVPAAALPAVKVYVPPYSDTVVPLLTCAASQIASARVTRTQPWLAG